MADVAASADNARAIAVKRSVDPSGCLMVTSRGTARQRRGERMLAERVAAGNFESYGLGVTRAARAAYRQIPAVTDTLRLSTLPCIGMAMSRSHDSRVSRRSP